MKRWFEQLVAESRLASIEADYLEWVWNRTSGMPDETRRQIASVASEMLGERPPAPDMEVLEEEIGQPKQFVDHQIEIGGLERSRPPRSARSILLRKGSLPSIGLLAFVGVGSWFGLRYFTAEPEFFTYCGGVKASEVEAKSAAGVSEYTATFRAGERVGFFFFCPGSSTEGVMIHDVRLNGTARGLPFQPVGWEHHVGGNPIGDASVGEPFDPEDNEFGSVESLLWFEMDYCYFSSAKGISGVEVEYRYRHRTRTMAVPIGYHPRIFAAEQCTTKVRTEEKRISEAWRRAVDPRIHVIEEFTSLRLSGEDVSRNLCRYLRGIIPVDEGRGPNMDSFEPLEARAVFQIEDPFARAMLIDGAVNGVCPEFGDREEELLSIGLARWP